MCIEGNRGDAHNKRYQATILAAAFLIPEGNMS